MYYLQETSDKQFEILFGSGPLGKPVKDGNIVQNGAHACSADCFKTDSAGMKNWYTYINGQKVYPNRSGSPYRFVMFEGASPSGNIASKCGGGNCKYNFANDTYTDLGNGQIYKAGE